MPSFDNQYNLNTQHRISEREKTFHKTTIRINTNCLYAIK